ncbi:MAG TPA: hypothetical protein VGR81_03355 [Candidatus Acidoferrales bacterium]|nr:hypothetical protein [Candidatus Acidoferrales bacterium]
MPTNTIPLDNAGMNYTAVATLKGLDISDPEVAELVKVKQAGLSDDACISLIRLARNDKERFHNGDDVAELVQAGIPEPTILDLAQIHSLNAWGGEAVAMHLAGLSDQIILEDIRRTAAGQPVLSGASLADFKNAGMSQSTLLQLVRIGVPDGEANKILNFRRRGWSDAAILRHYIEGK